MGQTSAARPVGDIIAGIRNGVPIEKLRCPSCGRSFRVNHVMPKLADELERSLVDGNIVSQDTSDGSHTFAELYHHRAVLFSVIVKAFRDIAWKSLRHHDGTMYDGYFIVGLDTPDGPATYHYEVEPYWTMFNCREIPFAPEWDGHTPDEAIRRIEGLKRLL